MYIFNFSKYFVISIKKNNKPLKFLPFNQPPLPKLIKFNTPFTKNQIQHFDLHYKTKRKVNIVNLKSKQPYIVHQLNKNNVQIILQNKIQNLNSLIQFIQCRSLNMKLNEIIFISLKLNHPQYQQLLKHSAIKIVQKCLQLITKIPKQLSLTLLQFAYKIQYKHDNLKLIINSYLQYILDKIVSTNQKQNIKFDLIWSFPIQIVVSSKRLFFQICRLRPQISIQIFCYFGHKELLSRDEIILFDKLFRNNIQIFSLQDGIRILKMFGRLQKKGMYLQIFKNNIKSKFYGDLTKTQIIFIMIQFSKLNCLEYQLYTSIQQNIITLLLTDQFNNSQICLLIQILHQSALGDLNIWQLLKSLDIKVKYKYNQNFAILSGFQRNFHYDTQLFIHMIFQDNQFQVIKIINNQDDFLKLMIVYYFNYTKLTQQNYKILVSAKIIDALKKVYLKRNYKTFINLFLWLFSRNQTEKQQFFLKLHLNNRQKALLNLLDFQHSEKNTDQQNYLKLNYVECIIIQYIRRKKIQYSNNNNQ